MNAEMTAADVLREARRLIQEKGWCRYAPALSASGVACSSQSPKAVAFCAWGALKRASNEASFGRARSFLIRATGVDDISNWNDAPGRTPEQVIAAFDRAIALAIVSGEPRPR